MVRMRGKDAFIITYNGELYNTADLRQDLEAKGHVFSGYSDTEVLLASYIEWGLTCLDHLNGIFAFAIWDEARRPCWTRRRRGRSSTAG